MHVKFPSMKPQPTFDGAISQLNLQVKKQAIFLVQGLTGSPDGISQLSSRRDTLIPALLRLVADSEQISRPALVSLVNLAQEPTVQKKLLDLNAASRCMDYLKDSISKGNEDLLVMLLANITAEEEGARALLQLGKGAMEGLNMYVLERDGEEQNQKNIYTHGSENLKPQRMSAALF